MPPERVWALPGTARRVLLLTPPLALAALEIVHPQPDVNAQAVMDVATWFAIFHVIQLALVGMVAVSVLLLADSFGRATAWSTRIGIGLFLVFYSAYDSVAGIATGLAMRSARDLSAAQQEGVFEVVKDWPAFGPPFLLSIIGTLGWLVAVGGLALAARRQGRPDSSGSSSGSLPCSCWAGIRSRPGRLRSAASSSERSCTSTVRPRASRADAGWSRRPISSAGSPGLNH